jgi:FKBP-type peptidyl-prolyl cis-trans isomerase
MIRSFRLACVAVLLAAAVGCGDDTPTSPTLNIPFSTTDLRVGTGAQVTTGSSLNVNYTGWLYSTTAADNKGAQFDSSAGRGPFTFTVGTGVITGWSNGVIGMRVGGLRKLVIPPDQGYGSAGAPPSIPPNATLLFEIELLSIN